MPLQRRSILVFLFSFLPSFVFTQTDNLLPPFAFLDISIDGGQQYSITLFAQASSFGKQLSNTLTPSYELVLADDGTGNDIYHFGCVPGPSLRPNGVPQALLIARGNCSFQQKVNNAQLIGAHAVIVYDGLGGKYFKNFNSTYENSDNPPPPNSLWIDECDSDCGSGSGFVELTDVNINEAIKGYPGQCNSNNQCQSNLCGLTSTSTTSSSTSSRDAESDVRQICCIPNDYVVMGSSSDDPSVNQITIPAVFVTAEDGYKLLKYMQVMEEDDHSLSSSILPSASVHLPLLRTAVSVFVKLALRPTSSFDAASVILWLLGCLTVGIASYLSAAEEREQYKARIEDRPMVRPVATSSFAPPTPAVSLTLHQALLFLLFSAGALVALYFLVKYSPFAVVYIIMTLFSFASLTSLRLILFHPLLDRLMPSLEDKVIYTLQYPVAYALTAATAISFAASFILVIVWLVFRQTDWAFVMQDLFGICLCCLFLLQLRLATLRTSTIALTAFFFWDIFAVFITPFIFGSSVMVDVATAGSPTQIANEACYCRLHPDDDKTCGPGESMPILLRIPRINDFRGGDSLLGLGDIVIPGLLLSFLLRTDYSVRGPLRILQKGRIKYWTCGMIGYFFGLAFANIAVVTMNMGQPALLYLVPCTLLPVIGLAYSRSELEALWNGRTVDLEHSVISGDDFDLATVSDGSHSGSGNSVQRTLLQVETGNEMNHGEQNPLIVEDDPALAYDPHERE